MFKCEHKYEWKSVFIVRAVGCFSIITPVFNYISSNQDQIKSWKSEHFTQGLMVSLIVVKSFVRVKMLFV